MKKLILSVAVVAAMGLTACATAPDSGSNASDLRNPAGGKIFQMMNPAAGAVAWQVVQADGASCQKFLSQFDGQPEVLKFSADCWLDADNESAKLPVKVAIKYAGKDMVMETVAPNAKVDSCAAAVTVLKTFKDVTVVGQCPVLPPAPAK